MNREIAPAPLDGWVEPLDIDLDTLDHALMELLTSDWQTLDDSMPPVAQEPAPRLSPTA